MKKSIKLMIILALISSTSFAHDCDKDIETKSDEKDVIIIRDGNLHKQLLILMNLGMMSKNKEGELELNEDADIFINELEKKGLIEDVLMRKGTICI